MTLWGYQNFGNKLQAIALKRIIEGMGYSVECVPSTPTSSRFKVFCIYIRERVRALLGMLGLKKYRNHYCIYIRSKYLKKTSDSLLKPYMQTIYNYDSSSIESKEYVAAVTGSDQVWHKWTSNPNELEFYYLYFMPSQKRISYAASFGFEKFNQHDLNSHIEGLNNMNSISCRESTGCNLVSEVSDKNAKLVLDPTLCVEKDYWISIEEKPQLEITSDYLFVMMLGNDDNYRNVIKEYALENNLKVINIMDEKNHDVWKTTIGGFVWLIDNASAICTDSFHCLAFSIIFKKSICVFKRDEEGHNNMFDRLKTLMDIAGIEKGMYDGKCLEFSNYNPSKNNIDNMKYESLQWLRQAFEKAENDED